MKKNGKDLPLKHRKDYFTSELEFSALDLALNELIRWWSVFWDVFIARSQSTGKRNPMADSYVEVSKNCNRESRKLTFSSSSQ